MKKHSCLAHFFLLILPFNLLPSLVDCLPEIAEDWTRCRYRREAKKSEFCSVMSPFSASACPKEEEGGGRFFPLHENNCSDCSKEEGASDVGDTTLSRKKNLSSSFGDRRRTNGKERVERERRRRRRPRFHNGKREGERERNRDYSPPKTTSLYPTPSSP